MSMIDNANFHKCIRCSELFSIDCASRIVYCDGSLGNIIDCYKNREEICRDFLRSDEAKVCSKKKYCSASVSSPDTRDCHRLSVSNDGRATYSYKRLYLYLTYRCNNNCRFCFLGGYKKGRQPKLEELYKWIKSAKTGETILLLGGEPTMSPHFFPVLAMAKSSGKKIGLISNGRNFSDRLLVKKAIARKLDSITISLHTHRERDHEYLTRSKGFNDTIIGIKNLLKSGKLRSLKVSILITKVNYTYLRELVEFLVGLGVNEFRFNSLFITADIEKRRRELLVDPISTVPYVEEAFDFLESCGEANWHLDAYPLCYINKKYWPHMPNERLSLQRSNLCGEKSFTFMTSLSKKCIDCPMKARCPGIYYNSLAYFGDKNLKLMRDE